MTYARYVALEARQLLGYSLEEVFLHAYPYFWERPVNHAFILRQYQKYMRAEEAELPEEVEYWSLHVLAGRISV